LKEDMMEPIVNIWNRLGDQERAILLRLGNKMLQGKAKYGEWMPENDSRRYTLEALDELVDCANYMMAEILRLERGVNGACDSVRRTDSEDVTQPFVLDSADGSDSRTLRAVGAAKSRRSTRGRTAGLYRSGRDGRGSDGS
jgi:hypothetical protein